MDKKLITCSIFLDLRKAYDIYHLSSIKELSSINSIFAVYIKELIRGRVDRASATDVVDTGSIPGRVKPKTIKIGIHSFPA